MTIQNEFSSAFSPAFDADDLPPSTSGICPWPISYASCGPCDALTSLPPAEQAMFEQMATDFLWAWTNQIFGICEVALRPCLSDCAGGHSWTTTFWGSGPYPWAGAMGGGSPWIPALIAGKWYNISCGCTGSCSCAVVGPTSLALPGPVQSISEVRVDGVTLPSSAYRVMYHRYLVRTDGDVWPACQDLLALPTEPGTFEVVYERGVPVPIGGQLSAGTLACEFAKAYCGDKSCQLPQRVSTVTRQGVTVGFIDQFEGIDAGKTGIWAIDSWVASVNAPKPLAGVRSVDVPQHRGSQWSRS